MIDIARIRRIAIASKLPDIKEFLELLLYLDDHGSSLSEDDLMYCKLVLQRLGIREYIREDLKND